MRNLFYSLLILVMVYNQSCKKDNDKPNNQNTTTGTTSTTSTTGTTGTIDTTKSVGSFTTNKLLKDTFTLSESVSIKVDYNIEGSKKFLLKTYLDSGYGNKVLKTDSLISKGTIDLPHKMGYGKTVFRFELVFEGKTLQTDSVVLYPVSSVRRFNDIKLIFYDNSNTYPGLSVYDNVKYNRIHDLEYDTITQRKIDMYFHHINYPSLTSPHYGDVGSLTEKWEKPKVVTTFGKINDFDIPSDINSYSITKLYETMKYPEPTIQIPTDGDPTEWISFKTQSGKHGLIHVHLNDVYYNEIKIDIIIQK